MKWKITPMNTGIIGVVKGFHMTQGRGLDVKTHIPATAWLLTSEPDGARKVLVDTGMCDTERANRYHHPGCLQKEGQAIGDQLRAMGIGPGEVELVIFTHLHWDHCSNMKLFQRARYVVHRAELEFARDPIPPYFRSYEAPALGIEPPFAGVSFEEVEGEQEILEGITVFPTPGHSPGHQSVSVDTPQGEYVIAGDAVFCWENLEGDPAAGLPVIPIGRFVDAFKMWNSLLRIKARTPNVLPGHEMGVFRD